MMTQEQAFLKSQQQLQAIQAYVEGASSQGERIDKVEREVFSQLLLIGQMLFKGFVAAQGEGDVGSTCEHEGRTLQRRDAVQERRYLSIFGELVIARCVYASGAKQKAVAPLDARLSLPADEFSYVLADWLQRLGVKESFHEGVPSLRELLGIAPSERAAEQMNQRLARFVEHFHLSQAPPAAWKLL